MTKRTSELSAIDRELALMVEVDPNKIPDRCFVCKSKQKVYVALSASGTLTKNKIGICQNSECFRHSDMTQVPSWVPERVLH